MTEAGQADHQDFFSFLENIDDEKECVLISSDVRLDSIADCGYHANSLRDWRYMKILDSHSDVQTFRRPQQEQQQQERRNITATL